jgi:hypothetical protein
LSLGRKRRLAVPVSDVSSIARTFALCFACSWFSVNALCVWSSGASLAGRHRGKWCFGRFFDRSRLEDKWPKLHACTRRRIVPCLTLLKRGSYYWSLSANTLFCMPVGQTVCYCFQWCYLGWCGQAMVHHWTKNPVYVQKGRSVLFCMLNRTNCILLACIQVPEHHAHARSLAALS